MKGNYKMDKIKILARVLWGCFIISFFIVVCDSILYIMLYKIFKFLALANEETIRNFAVFILIFFLLSFLNISPILGAIVGFLFPVFMIACFITIASSVGGFSEFFNFLGFCFSLGITFCFWCFFYGLKKIYVDGDYGFFEGVVMGKGSSAYESNDLPQTYSEQEPKRPEIHIHLHQQNNNFYVIKTDNNNNVIDVEEIK